MQITPSPSSCVHKWVVTTLDVLTPPVPNTKCLQVNSPWYESVMGNSKYVLNFIHKRGWVREERAPSLTARVYKKATTFIQFISDLRSNARDNVLVHGLSRALRRFMVRIGSRYPEG